MTSGGNHFSYFAENQLIKFKLCPLNFLIFVPSPEDFCDAFCVAGGAFGRPWAEKCCAKISISLSRPPLDESIGSFNDFVGAAADGAVRMETIDGKRPMESFHGRNSSRLIDRFQFTERGRTLSIGVVHIARSMHYRLY